MIDCESFYQCLQQQGVTFFAGVPDSLLKNICAFITDHADESNHIITANEGAAVALAAGVYLATGRIPLVYLQNSGLGNMVNPLTSLADPDVYSIPMILLIGWRGEPGVPDEPQHRKQGRIMTAMLDVLEIPYHVLPLDNEEANKTMQTAVAAACQTSSPQAILVRKDTFGTYKLGRSFPDAFHMSRESAIKTVLENLSPDSVFVSTTGMTSREVFEYRANTKSGHGKDFLTVGSMGHASQIAFGISLKKPHLNVYCIDGDGAILMHLGSLGINGSANAPNFKHILINNGAHDSVGGQPTVGLSLDLPAVAKACGYQWVASVDDPEELPSVIREFETIEGPALLEIKVNKGARSNLGRPTTTPVENKESFMAHLNSLT